ncbi:arginine/lysine/ornithine decarboxylase [Amycolatopsis endophytica]|uniref:Arginine/lysine/ornithine decarboxylase n=1 Tax=Amycolatopsis endophytica TaxID=860233 RepID=A0A853BD28_9PSEU|nr:hypothetical protein [Amycolatopsis endophytica]NYI92571.1 arginine/lysine/ornithine decarboxylase [Amycolatopsis endophytica]
MIETVRAYRERGHLGFLPPGHKQGRGLDPRLAEELLVSRNAHGDPRAPASRADLLGTTSPSSLIFAGLDGWRRHRVQHGEELLGRALELCRSVRTELAALPGIRVPERDDLVGPGPADDHDPLKTLLDLEELGRSGTTRANGRASTTGSTWACPTTAGWPPRSRSPTTRRPPAAARRVLRARRGRSGGGGGRPDLRRDDQPVPPGMPAVAPGEVITRPVVDDLRGGPGAGMYLPGPADPALDTIRVVRDWPVSRSRRRGPAGRSASGSPDPFWTAHA